MRRKGVVDMTKRLTIKVRSRDDRFGGWNTEWMETAHSWPAAWKIVDEAGADRSTCRKWQSGDTWFLDIDGVREHEQQVNSLQSLIDKCN